MPKCDACGHDHDALTQQLTDAQTQLAAAQAKETGWALERAEIRSGLEEEGVAFARAAWDRLAPDKRPQGGYDAWLADRANLPRGVQAYLPPAPAAPPASSPAGSGSVPAQQPPPAQPAAPAAPQAAPPPPRTPGPAASRPARSSA
jgi:hypothetical protein